jgi:hypothetical protein
VLAAKHLADTTDFSVLFGLSIVADEESSSSPRGGHHHDIITVLLTETLML